MYENYFARNKYKIQIGLKKWISEGKKVAIWSAGNKGKDFLKIYDPAREYISAVFDKDLSKIGTLMPTGHVVQDYRCVKTDIIILVDDSYHVDTRLLLLRTANSSKICCLNDVIFGSYSMEEALSLKTVKPAQHLRLSRIASLTILYHPNKRVIDNVYTYAPFVDEVYIFDNSPLSNERFFYQIKKQYPIYYYHCGGRNLGIGTPINYISKIARKKQFDWLITFDQDSSASIDMVPQMRRYVESDILDVNAGVIGPVEKKYFDDYDAEKYAQYIPYLTYKRDVIQSGAMHNISVMEEIGGYDERMFIDQVDNEYCARLRIANHPTIQLNHAILNHQIEDKKFATKMSAAGEICVGKYSPNRYYYQFRNLLYCKKKYCILDPIFSEECSVEYERLKARMEQDVFYEENTKMLQRAQYDAEHDLLGPVV